MYYAIVNWYDESREQTTTDYILVGAKNWADAMGHIEHSYDNIEGVEIECLVEEEQHIVYLPESVSLAVKAANLW